MMKDCLLSFLRAHMVPQRDAAQRAPSSPQCVKNAAAKRSKILAAAFSTLDNSTRSLNSSKP
uniref:Uncharacterized protein n=1 Tax=Manihot esculenta TaxID=3983 RepID=A0A2C9UWP7_MANES